MSKTLRSAHEALAAELIETIKRCDPEFFERLVVQLLLRMGYGGSRQEAGQAVGRSGDGGIDGVINEDRLGLDAIYLQAKRWEGSVGEGPIRDFKGALDARRARKGVLITTSSFTPAAIEAARNSHSYKIVLIDGARLADLMIEHNLGVSVTATSSPCSGRSATGCRAGPTTMDTQGHSGRLSRLFGCSPSFSVFKYLLPGALTATITRTAWPLALTKNSHLRDSIPAIASCCESFQRPPSGLMPPMD